MNRRTGISTALATLVAVSTLAATGPVAAADGADPPREYVALGDSAAAGPLILPVDVSQPDCLRSLRNYPNVTADVLDATAFRDVTCSGATTEHMTQPQGDAPPQFDALSERTTLVTITIGGNDVGLVQLALDCLNVLPPPFGAPCVDRYTEGGVDRIAERIDRFEPQIGVTLDKLRARAPNADVYVVGYGTYLPRNGCYPVVPVLPQDANYIQANISRLNDALARQAHAHGAHYVDVESVSQGHDVCRLPGVKWYEAVVPTSIAAPLHPNAVGMRGTGRYVAGAVD